MGLAARSGPAARAASGRPKVGASSAARAGAEAMTAASARAGGSALGLVPAIVAAGSGSGRARKPSQIAAPANVATARAAPAAATLRGERRAGGRATSPEGKAPDADWVSSA